ncbi:MAG: NADH-quinone oxidoreductase subunit C [Burkholderiaceae bacterium]|nr:NADH-quinone oxidoreductase subunit C [Burkholderiaceae bacterium]
MESESLSDKYGVPFKRMRGDTPICIADVDAQEWLHIAQTIRTEGGILVSLWGTDRRTSTAPFIVSATYCVSRNLLWVRLPVANEQTGYPDLSNIFPAASRMQRATFDLLGISANGAEDTRPWINHGKWPRDYFPLRKQFTGQEQFDTPLEFYPFVSVEGDGVHEIGVGPIHAGIIEPGHFRFSIVGEKVLRLEELLGYTHKGVDKLFTQRDISNGHLLAGRISGDSTVAYSWAYCMAVETATCGDISARAQWLRALLQERERIAHHLGDLGALGNDAGLVFGLAQFSLLREKWVRLNGRLFNHRFMMDCIIPGGVNVDIDDVGGNLLLAQCQEVEAEVKTLRDIYAAHSGLQDRFHTLGRVFPKLAEELGLCGIAGRASDQARDARVDQALPNSAYTQNKARKTGHKSGDVAARVYVRFEEIFESIRLLREIINHLPPGPTHVPLPGNFTDGLGAGWVEGWRGPVFVALETDSDGKIIRCHCHDPSWQNWPVLEHAIIGDIVPDFPLINKSFNLSYSGHDL